eukprot:3174347-Alexandrium_andersonii.AAC.1
MGLTSVAECSTVASAVATASASIWGGVGNLPRGVRTECPQTLRTFSRHSCALEHPTARVVACPPVWKGSGQATPGLPNSPE